MRILQKCSGLPAGQEAAVHAMQKLYEDQSVEGLLLVDAKNASNSMNRKAALHNVQPSRRFCGIIIRLHLGSLFPVVVRSAPEKVRHRVTHCPCPFTLWPFFLCCGNYRTNTRWYGKRGWQMTLQGLGWSPACVETVVGLTVLSRYRLWI